MSEGGRRELEFIAELGRGGFGAVYLANLHGADRFVRRVAVKVMKPGLHLDQQLLARQRDEARLLGLISHHAVVQVLDLAVVDGQPAVVMEYIEGVDGARMMQRLRADGATMPERAALEIAGTAASALDAVYNTVSPESGAPLRVIHRDIKPANLLITSHGGVKVLDFGVARADFDREGVTGSAFFGTAAYMAPEFWLQEPIGPAYDIYALGVTLLELLSAQPPQRVLAERARYRTWLSERLGQLVGVSPDTLRLLASILSFDQADRPTAASVHEQCEALAGRSETESVGRLARRLVPPLISAGRAASAPDGLPARAPLLSPAIGAPRPIAGALPTPSPRERSSGETTPVPADTAPAGASPTTLPLPRAAIGPAEGASTSRALPALFAALVLFALVGTAGALAIWRGLPETDVAGAATEVAAALDVAAPTGALEGPPPPNSATAQPASPNEAAAPALGSETSPPSTPRATEPAGARLDASRTLGTPASVSPTVTAAGSGQAQPAPSPVGASTAASPPASPAPATTAPVAVPSTTVVTTAPAPQRVKFSTDPMGIAVKIDGRQSCYTPCSVALADGPHTLTLQGEDGAVQRTLTIGADQASDYSYDWATKVWKVNLH